jgi:hypothetical protein
VGAQYVQEGGVGGGRAHIEAASFQPQQWLAAGHGMLFELGDKARLAAACLADQ